MAGFGYLLFIACAVLVSVKISDGATFTLGVLIPWTVDWELGQHMGSAVGVALREIEDRGLLSGHTVQWQWKDTMCQPLTGVNAALDLFDENGGVDAYIGGGCSSVCEPAALTAAARNLPFISFGCNSQMLSDKTTFPTFTRSVGTWLSLAPMVEELMTWFSWDRVAILNTHDHIMQETADSIKHIVETRRGAGSVIEKAISSTHDNDTLVHAELENQREALRSMKDQARIFIILMNDADIHMALLSAYDEGMMDGEYVFITFEASLSERFSPNYRPEKSKEVYHGVISANLRKPADAAWGVFAQDVIDEFQSETKFNGYAKLAADAAVSDVDVHAGFLHDAVLMWAYGMNLSLAAGNVDGTDGLDVNSEIINNVDFQGITGRVLITDFGDREADYTISIAQDGQWTDLLRWDAVNNQLQKLYQTEQGPDSWSGIWWSGNSSVVPRGAPECGWENEHCQGLSGGEKAAISIFVILVLIVGIVGVFVYLFKRSRFEADLMDFSTWKVNWSELTLNRLAEQIASSRASLKTAKTYGGLVKDGGNRPEVVDYKGRTVVVKRLDTKSSIDLENRDILLDVKMMREVKHDNLNVFVGACTDAPNVSIFWEYASKGSVQDVIKNTDINLSWDFRLSIANDIAQGMTFLHSSPIGFHGNLNSHNCVVNSRWICKITDFGLHEFKKGARRRIRCNVLEGADKLWTAPEHLNCDEGLKGSAKGDVYSYAVVLQELILKDGPYCCNMSQAEIEPLAIVDKVAAGGSTPYRPVLPQGCCSDSWRSLVENCWSEDPAARPDFTQIKGFLRELNGGKSIDVIENIIKMMEQHTEHLEELVSVKTSDACKEKDKVITLLNNLIPRSIAEQLGRGDEVHPEHFESATIFMSDITGFSALKNQSTPDQMVEILNSISQAFMEMTDTYDITRVDAVGEQNILVSGVPQRNGDGHVTEVATMALDIVNSAAAFNIKHMPGTSLQLRVAMHTGPVVSCIVGLSTPRFYLYGDAMDVVSGIHSTSMSLRILVSATSAEMLEKAGGYKLECRGVTTVKGQGEMTTFWLLEKDGFKKVPDMFKANQ